MHNAQLRWLPTEVNVRFWPIAVLRRAGTRVSGNFTVTVRGQLPERPQMAGCGPSLQNAAGYLESVDHQAGHWTRYVCLWPVAVVLHARA